MSINAKTIIKSVDDLKREVVFICYEPNVLDCHGQWMSLQTLEKACANFNDNYAKGIVKENLFHYRDENGVVEKTDTFNIIKSWITPVECVIGETEVKEGTWLMKLKILNDTLWDAFMSGDVKGISIGARGEVGND